MPFSLWWCSKKPVLGIIHRLCKIGFRKDGFSKIDSLRALYIIFRILSASVLVFTQKGISPQRNACMFSSAVTTGQSGFSNAEMWYFSPYTSLYISSTDKSLPYLAANCWCLADRLVRKHIRKSKKNHLRYTDITIVTIAEIIAPIQNKI